MRIVVALIALAAAASCSSSHESRSRSFNNDQHYWVTEPAGWERRVEGGATIYQGTGEQARHTIVIRTATRPTAPGKETLAPFDTIEQQTRMAIHAIPGVRIEGVHRIEHTDGDAEELSFIFRPRVAHGALYQRRQVVIVGRSKIFQVFYTAPSGETIDGDEFDAVVSSLQEEG